MNASLWTEGDESGIIGLGHQKPGSWSRMLVPKGTPHPWLRRKSDTTVRRNSQGWGTEGVFESEAHQGLTVQLWCEQEPLWRAAQASSFHSDSKTRVPDLPPTGRLRSIAGQLVHVTQGQVNPQKIPGKLGDDLLPLCLSRLEARSWDSPFPISVYLLPSWKQRTRIWEWQACGHTLKCTCLYLFVYCLSRFLLCNN